MKTFLSAFIAGILPAFILMFSIQTSLAGSATWNLNPATDDWNTAPNWTPNTVPSHPPDTATFSLSNTTTVVLSHSVTLNGITFTAGASAYSLITGQVRGFTISGAGIINNSGVVQNFTISGTRGTSQPAFLDFTDNATAGSMTKFTNQHGFDIGGLITFHGNSNAGSATFVNEAAPSSGSIQGLIAFFGGSSAGSASFTAEGSPSVTVSGAPIFFFDDSTAGEATFELERAGRQAGFGGDVHFFDNSTMDNGVFTVSSGPAPYGNGYVLLEDTASAGAATIIVDGTEESGGIITFLDNSNGGTSRVEFPGGAGSGLLDISFHNPPGVSIGSIEGEGQVLLGANRLTVGSNNLSTTFSGSIGNGESGKVGGSLAKTGESTLTLAGASTYTGGTLVDRGTLIINNTAGSGTGTGRVVVNNGTLGGTGTITGAVTIGGGARSAVLMPGVNGIGLLTIQSTLAFAANSAYNWNVQTETFESNEVASFGVTIDVGASFSALGYGGGIIPSGTVFTVIENTAATPIAGTFSNLADGSIFTANGNNFQADYQGGDGNDLTLTVVP